MAVPNGLRSHALQAYCLRMNYSRLYTISLIGLLSLTAQCCAATVGGLVSANTNWSLADSPYIATSSVLVDAGATLTIEPGVEVRFTQGTGLVVVNGTLSARGTTASPITFTADQAGVANAWNGIRFGDLATNAMLNGDEYVSGSVLQASIIEGVGQHPNGAVRIESSSPLIQSNEIINNLTSGIRAVTTHGLQIVGNQIHHNESTVIGGGIYIDRSAGVRVSHN
jgi:hypothetical protein